MAKLDSASGASASTYERTARDAPPETAPPLHIRLSSSVESVRRSSVGLVTAGDLVNALLKLHPEYGRTANARRASAPPESSEGQTGESFQLQTDAPGLERLTSDEWLVRVQALYDPAKLNVLHGRAFILGLALLDRNVAIQLSRNGFFRQLEREIAPDVQFRNGSFVLDGQAFDETLSATGREMRAKLAISPDSVPTHRDRPTGVDLLGRAGLGATLAARIRDAATDRTSGKWAPDVFVLHIDGAWGSGKSSLMKLIAANLRGPATSLKSAPVPSSGEWVVVEFNAWRHQRLGTPWWWLLQAVSRQAQTQLPWIRSRWLWIQDGQWLYRRLSWMPYPVGAIFVLSMLVLLVSTLSGTPVDQMWANWPTELTTLVKNAKDIAAVGTLIGVLWAFGVPLARRVLFRTVRGGELLLDSTSDPQRELRKYFAHLVRTINRPIAIFIDDLDRCREDSIVELLEGIQTLFGDFSDARGEFPITTPVAYVIAADGRWLRSAYCSVYQKFIDTVREPGRPMGYLFLEKLVQLTVQVPPISTVKQDEYWQRLLSEDDATNQSAIAAATSKAEADLDSVANREDAIINLLQERLGRDPLEVEALRHAAAQRLANPVFREKRYAHTLRPLSTLLEPNPRAMIRLVNAYSVERELNTLTGDTMVDSRQLGRWTLVKLRWPLLADYLAIHPEDADALLQQSVPTRTSEKMDVQGLFTDTEVYNVFRGGDRLGEPLTASVVRACVGLPKLAPGGETT